MAYLPTDTDYAGGFGPATNTSGMPSGWVGMDPFQQARLQGFTGTRADWNAMQAGMAPGPKAGMSAPGSGGGGLPQLGSNPSLADLTRYFEQAGPADGDPAYWARVAMEKIGKGAGVNDTLGYLTGRADFKTLGGSGGGGYGGYGGGGGFTPMAPFQFERANFSRFRAPEITAPDAFNYTGPQLGGPERFSFNQAVPSLNLPSYGGGGGRRGSDSGGYGSWSNSGGGIPGPFQSGRATNQGGGQMPGSQGSGLQQSIPVGTGAVAGPSMQGTIAQGSGAAPGTSMQPAGADASASGPGASFSPFGPSAEAMAGRGASAPTPGDTTGWTPPSAASMTGRGVSSAPGGGMDAPSGGGMTPWSGAAGTERSGMAPSVPAGAPTMGGGPGGANVAKGGGLPAWATGGGGGMATNAPEMSAGGGDPRMGGGVPSGVPQGMGSQGGGGMGGGPQGGFVPQGGGYGQMMGGGGPQGGFGGGPQGQMMGGPGGGGQGGGGWQDWNGDPMNVPTFSSPQPFRNPYGDFRAPSGPRNPGLYNQAETFNFGQGVPTPERYDPNTFKAPTAEEAANDPGYQFAVNQAEQQMKQDAARSGRLLTTGTQSALMDRARQEASQQYGDVYARRANEFGQSEANRFNAAQFNTGAAQSAQALGYSQAANTAGMNEANRLNAYNATNTAQRNFQNDQYSQASNTYNTNYGNRFNESQAAQDNARANYALNASTQLGAQGQGYGQALEANRLALAQQQQGFGQALAGSQFNAGNELAYQNQAWQQQFNPWQVHSGQQLSAAQSNQSAAGQANALNASQEQGEYGANYGAARDAYQFAQQQNQFGQNMGLNWAQYGLGAQNQMFNQNATSYGMNQATAWGDQDRAWRQQMDLANLGYGALGGMNQGYQNYNNNITDLYGQQGNIGAAGQVGGANPWISYLGSLGGYYGAYGY